LQNAYKNKKKNESDLLCFRMICSTNIIRDIIFKRFHENSFFFHVKFNNSWIEKQKTIVSRTSRIVLLKLQFIQRVNIRYIIFLECIKIIFKQKNKLKRWTFVFIIFHRNRKWSLYYVDLATLWIKIKCVMLQCICVRIPSSIELWKMFSV
jgi:hypothetical protein